MDDEWLQEVERQHIKVTLIPEGSFKYDGTVHQEGLYSCYKCKSGPWPCNALLLIDEVRRLRSLNDEEKVER